MAFLHNSSRKQPLQTTGLCRYVIDNTGNEKEEYFLKLEDSAGHNSSIP